MPGGMAGDRSEVGKLALVEVNIDVHLSTAGASVPLSARSLWRSPSLRGPNNTSASTLLLLLEKTLPQIANTHGQLQFMKPQRLATHRLLICYVENRVSAITAGAFGEHRSDCDRQLPDQGGHPFRQ